MKKLWLPVIAFLLLGISPCESGGQKATSKTCSEGTYAVTETQCCPNGTKYELGLCSNPQASSSMGNASGSSPTDGTAPVAPSDTQAAGATKGPQPQITSIIGDGTTGLVREGIVIKGVNFGTQPEVLLGSASLSVARATDSEIEATLPSDVAVGPNVVTVRTAAGQATQDVSILKGEKGDAGLAGATGAAGKDASLGANKLTVVQDLSAGWYAVTDPSGVGGISCPGVNTVMGLGCRCNGIGSYLFSCRPAINYQGQQPAGAVGACYGSGSVDVYVSCMSLLMNQVYSPAPERNRVDTLNLAIREARVMKFLHDRTVYFSD